MICLRLGNWGRNTGRWFFYDRIYGKNWKWTPFCNIVRISKWNDYKKGKFCTWFENRIKPSRAVLAELYIDWLDSKEGI